MVFDKKAWSKSPKGIKSRIVSKWKINGIIHNEGLSHLYDSIYLPATKCEKCNVEFGTKGDGSGTFKTCDHNHSIIDSHNFRNILCSACNVNDKSNNTSGTPNIYKHGDGWLYQKWIKGVRHQKYFKTKEEAIEYKKKI